MPVVVNSPCKKWILGLSFGASALLAIFFVWATSGEPSLLHKFIERFAVGKHFTTDTMESMVYRQFWVSLVKGNLYLVLLCYFWTPLKNLVAKTWQDPDRRKIIIVAGVLQLLFFITFPFYMAGDGGNYWFMAREQARLIRFSNLIQTPGYSFFMSWFMFTIGMFVDPYIFSLVQKMMYVIHALLLYEIGKYFLPRIWSLAGAFLFAIAIPFATLAHHSRPEYATSFFITLSLFLLLRAIRKESSWQEYFVAGLPGSLSCLCRINSFLVPGSLLLLLFIVGLRSRRRPEELLKQFFAYGVGIASLFLFYLFVVHIPSTGTWKYTISSGWHTTYHMDIYDRLKKTSTFPDPSVGPYSKKLYDFTQLPLEWIPHIDFRQYARLQGPQSFPKDIPPVPAKQFVDWRVKYQGYPRHHYQWVHGWEEGDKEMAAAFFEHVKAYPIAYLDSIVAMTWEFFRREKDGDERRLPDPKELTILKDYPLGFKKAAIDKSRTRTFNHDGLYWWPGVHFFEWGMRVLNYPPLLFLIGTLLVFPVCLITRRWSADVLSLLLGAVLYIVVSIGLSEGGAKSIVPVFPLCWLLTLFAVYTLVDKIMTLIKPTTHASGK